MLIADWSAKTIKKKKTFRNALVERGTISVLHTGKSGANHTEHLSTSSFRTPLFIASSRRRHTYAGDLLEGSAQATKATGVLPPVPRTALSFGGLAGPTLRKTPRTNPKFERVAGQVVRFNARQSASLEIAARRGACFSYIAMSRAIVRSMNLRRAVLKAGSRSLGGATGAVGGSTRRFAFQAPSLHPPSINAYGRQNQARYGGYGGLAVAVAGSVSLLVLSQVDGVEELLPSFAGQGSSPKRIQDVSGKDLLALIQQLKSARILLYNKTVEILVVFALVGCEARQGRGVCLKRSDEREKASILGACCSQGHAQSRSWRCKRWPLGLASLNCQLPACVCFPLSGCLSF